jgi:hypothetical protein
MKFFLRLPLALKWKKRVFASPSRMVEILAACFLRAFSMISQLSVCFFSFVRRMCSASERSRKSWTSSKRRMTSCAIRSFCHALERRDLLHFLSAAVVVKSLCPRRWKGSVCEEGAFQAWATISWKAGRRVQNFLNLNGAGRRGPTWFARSSGQWSEWVEERACREQPSKVKSQLWLQKTLSSRTRVGWRLSLLQVYFRFCKRSSLIWQ